MFDLTRLLRGLGFGAAAALLALLIGLGGLARTAELKLYDWRVRATTASRAASTDPGVVLVTIDDDSLKRMEPLVGRWPWPRLVHATLLDYLAAGGARAVVYDVLFAEADRSKFMVGDTEWTGEESDQALVEATARAGNVIHVAEAASAELLDPEQGRGRVARRGAGAQPAVRGRRLRRAATAGDAAVPGPRARGTRHRSLARRLRRGRSAAAGGAVGSCRPAPDGQPGVGSRAVKRNASSRHYLLPR